MEDEYQYTQEDMDKAYQAGYEKGHEDGYEAGLEAV